MRFTGAFFTFMSKNFVHLHNHTEYSMLDGANRVSDMVAKAKELEMESIAITDHGVMFGVMEFYMKAKEAKIKPILGVEAYVAPRGYKVKDSKAGKEFYHLLLLAKDLDGYRNLCKLSSIAALEGYYYKPRIDHELLRTHAKGLIGTTTCLGSEVCQALMNGDYAQAQYIAGMYKEIFDEGSYFVELQDHGLREQHEIKDGLLRIAHELNLPLIATNDAHYLCKSDNKPHDVLLCIQTGELVANTNRMKFETQEFYLKSKEEMGELFKEYPEALENTEMVAAMCNVELDKAKADMPQPDVPEGVSNFDYLTQLATEGLKDRSKNAEQKLARLEYELGIIKQTGFGDYFLLVREFANATRDKGIYFGVRGSAAGSLVSYTLGITDVDPVDFDLTFERFLNPERISMPDIDMDFEDARRDEVIQWVTDKYGKDHVAQIITYGTLGAKAAIKDCGRVLGYSPQETDRLTKLIPSAVGTTLSSAYKDVKDFREAVEADPRIRDLYDTALSVEGMKRNSGVHAAGVVIAKGPLVDYVPLYRGNDGQAITAYEMKILEKIGLLKMDFLGLSNLTVLAKCVENIRKATGETIDPRLADEGDQKTWDMLARGETTGVFQLEGGGMTRWVTQLKPQNVRELAAMIALYRPGPMEHIPRFIDTKFGKVQPEYLDSRMEPILEETYGIIVYQDQVLKLVQAIAGFTLGKADILRRAMGKKDLKAMTGMKIEFMDGTSAAGILAENAEKIWEMLLPFAGYAFNKAHAVCYALLSHQTAFLKANYPVEYMSALLAVYRTKEDRVTAFIEECRRMKILILPPDVNKSVSDFSIEEVGKKGQKAIRFGLGAIKGVGDGIVDAIIQDRTKEGAYTHLYEFAERIKPFGINKTALEALIKAGALDSIDTNRAKLLQYMEAALHFADTQTRNRAAGQDSLFGEASGAPMSQSYPLLPDVDQLSRSDKLAVEKEVLGIYVSDHPLRGLEQSINRASTHRLSAIPELEDGTYVKIAGVIAGFKAILTKTGKRMATVTLEDFSGQIGVMAFSSTFDRFKDQLQKDTVVAMSGYVSIQERRGEKTIEVRLEDVKPLDPALDFGMAQESRAAGTMVVSFRKATEGQLSDLKTLIREHPGDYDVMLQLEPESEFLPILLPLPVQGTDLIVEGIKRLIPRVEVKLTENLIGGV